MYGVFLLLRVRRRATTTVSGAADRMLCKLLVTTVQILTILFLFDEHKEHLKLKSELQRASRERPTTATSRMAVFD